MPKRRGAYPEEELADLAAIIRGSRDKHSVDAPLMGARLAQFLADYDLLDLPADSDDKDAEFTQAFREALAAPRTVHDFAAMATHTDALIQALRAGVVGSMINARARALTAGRKPKVAVGSELRAAAQGFRFTEDLAVALSLLRQAAEDLATYERARVRRGRPYKNDITDVVLALADIFVEVTGFEGPREALPSAPESRFINWMSNALRGVFALSETSPKALARRFARLKNVTTEAKN